MPEFHGQHASACFLILFADDVDPDKELRRDHGLDFEVKSFVKGVKVHSSAPSVWHRGLFRCNFYYSSAIKVSNSKCAPLRVRIGSQHEDANYCHLLSSVDLVLYCYTNGRTRVPTVLSLASWAASVFASSLGPLWIVRCIVLLQRAVHLPSAHYCHSCVVVHFIHRPG